MSDQRKTRPYGGKTPAGENSKTSPKERNGKTNVKSGGKRDTAPQSNAPSQRSLRVSENSKNAENVERYEAVAVTVEISVEEILDWADVKKAKERKTAQTEKYRLPRNWEGSLGTCAKVFSILLPIATFLAGQIALYVLYFTQNRVLLFDFVSDNVSVYALIVSSVFALVSCVLVSCGSWGYADDGERLKSWLYSLISGILLGVLPHVTGFIGVISASIMMYSVRNEKEEIVPAATVFTAFALGQTVMWFLYAGKGYSAVLSELWEAVSLRIPMLIPLIISSVLCSISVVFIAIAGYKLTEEYHGWKAFGYVLPMCLAVVFAPSFIGIPALIYALIVRSAEDSGSVKLFPITCILIAMASMGIIFLPNVPQYVPIIVSAVEIALFLILFNGRGGLSDYGEEYPVFIIVVLTLAGAVVLILQIVFMEDMFPKLAQIRELIAGGKASREFYDRELGELRATMIMGYIVLAIAMVIGVCMGDRNVSSVISPLAVAGGSPSLVMILNALIEMPEGVGSVYEPSFFLWTVIGAVLVAIPCAVYLAVVCSIGNATLD